jgi:hypothetical protein
MGRVVSFVDSRYDTQLDWRTDGIAILGAGRYTIQGRRGGRQDGVFVLVEYSMAMDYHLR